MRSQKLSVREERKWRRERRSVSNIVLLFFFWFSQELNNLTVINFARYAVRRSRNQRFFDEKGTFHDFLTNRQVNFTTEKKVQKLDCDNFVVSQRDFSLKKNHRGGLMFFKTTEYFFLKRKKTKQKKTLRMIAYFVPILC